MTKRIPSLLRFAACWLALLAVAAPATALQAPAGLAALETEEDVDALETLAVQEPALRDAALVASLHVDRLVELQRIQEHSSSQFQDRIASLDRDAQEQLWDLVREPGLVDALVEGAPHSRRDLDAIARRHRPELASAIRTFGAGHDELLADVHEIRLSAERRFDALIEDLPERDREAFRDLVEHPDLMSMLARRVRVAVHLGEAYREDPEATRRHLAELGAEVEARNARAREDFAEEIADDPAARSELEASARAYADEQGYDYAELTDPAVRTRVTVVVHPYPYWYGYPHWYVDHHYYPYGFWYPHHLHLGFYYDHGRFVAFGFPSPLFVHWFFTRHYHRHHDHYTHLVRRFDHFHRRHPHARGHFPRVVSHWKRHREARHHREVGFRDGRHRDHRTRSSDDWRRRDDRGRRALFDRRAVRDGGDPRRFERFRRDRDRLRDDDRARGRDRSRDGDRARGRDRSRDGDRARGRDRDLRDREARRSPRERGERDVRPDRGERRQRDVRPDRGERRQRDVRPDRGERRQRDVRPDRGERRQRDVRPDRGERRQRDARPDRGERRQRDARTSREARRERSAAPRPPRVDRDRGSWRGNRGVGAGPRQEASRGSGDRMRGRSGDRMRGRSGDRMRGRSGDRRGGRPGGGRGRGGRGR